MQKERVLGEKPVAEKTLEEKPLDMQQFDPMNVVRVAKRILASLRDPRRIQILQSFIAQAEAEAVGDYESLMASCSRRRQSYSKHGDGGVVADWQPRSYEELREHYRTLIEANIYLVHLDVEKLRVADDEVVVEGIVHQLYRGEMLRAMFGIEVDDDDAVYQLTKRMLIIFVYDEDGLGCGEQVYTNGPVARGDFVRVDNALVPEQFWHNPLTGEIPRQRANPVLTQ